MNQKNGKKRLILESEDKDKDKSQKENIPIILNKIILITGTDIVPGENEILITILSRKGGFCVLITVYWLLCTDSITVVSKEIITIWIKKETCVSAIT